MDNNKQDYQCMRAYQWETPIHDMFNDVICFEKAQTFVDYIWNDLELKNPPRITRLSDYKMLQGIEACARREEIQIPIRGIKSSILLHELAHSMTPFDVGHGPEWLGVYMSLLVRYYRMNMDALIYSVRRAGLEFCIPEKISIKERSVNYG